MKRIAIVLVAVAIVAVAVYWFALRGSSTPSAEAQPPRPVAQIGEGKRVIVIAGDGRVIGGASGKSKTQLPVLPLKERPTGKRLKGHVLEQVHVIAAAPHALRRYIATSNYGQTGVDVVLTSGIDIRFGDDHQAARKWKAAAAVLADPSVTLLSYVDVHAPTRPAVGGEEHELPPAS
ncbi:MAG TPA: cell division protein FtsQ/DivIB [Solirubrobacterales bacterium]